MGVAGTQRMVSLWGAQGWRLLAGKQVKGYSPAPIWQRQRQRAEMGWGRYWGGPYQCRSWNCNRPASLAAERFALGAGCGVKAAPTRPGPVPGCSAVELGSALGRAPTHRSLSTPNSLSSWAWGGGPDITPTPGFSPSSAHPRHPRCSSPPCQDCRILPTNLSKLPSQHTAQAQF